MSSTTSTAQSSTRRGVAFAQRFSWLGVLAVGGAAYLLVLRTLLATQNLNFVPSLILLGSVVVPASVLVFATSSSQQVTVPSGLIALVAIGGGVVGTVAAGTWEYDALHRLGALPMIVVGLVEETAKLIVPVLVLLLPRYRNSPGAGVVIGVASGMGFATLETMGYGLSTLLSTRSLAAMDSELLLRALLSPAGHVAWTGVTAAALWSAVLARNRRQAVLRLIGVFVTAVLLHAAWDGFNDLWAHLIVGGVSFAALLITIHRVSAGTYLRCSPVALVRDL